MALEGNTRRDFLRKTSAYGSVIGVTTVSAVGTAAAARRTMSVTETLGVDNDSNGDGHNDGDIDYTIAVTGTDVTGEGDLESEDDISIDYNHDMTHIYGTVNGETDTYSFPSDEHIEFVEATGWKPHAPYDSPTIVIDVDSGSAYGTYQLEVTGHENCCYFETQPYWIEVSDDINPDGYLESTESWSGNTAEGEVDQNDLDQWEYTGSFTRIKIRPKGGKVQLDSK